MKKRTTIYDIANRLGISTATVNRALTGKPQVKEETRRLVIETAAEMDFKPNALARSLARRRMRLAVLGFTSFPEFHGDFLRGAREAGDELADFNVSVDYFSYDKGATNTPESDAFLEDTLRHIADEGYDGALVLARHSESFRLLADKGVYVATAVNDISNAMRKFYICYDGYVAGRMAAELIYRWMPDRTRPVAVASGWVEEKGIHFNIVNGFHDQLPITPLNLCCVYHNQDNEDLAYENTTALLKRQPQLGAIYVNSFNYRGVIRAVQDAGRAGDILLITSDISEELRTLIRRGVVAASIFQNQYEQGKQGLHRLYHAIGNDEPVEGRIAIAPQLILGSNLTLF